MAPLNTTSILPRHFLFLLPATATEAERQAVIESARTLLPRGYVYVASPAEPTMEDRENIRFMPLNLKALPSFGDVTAVCVVRDQTIAIAARDAYPRTEVTVIDPLARETPEVIDRPVASWLAGSDDILEAA
ncbi:MAG: hypothetical protein ACO1TE_25815 [Prosthecobacter sp.]